MEMSAEKLDDIKRNYEEFKKSENYEERRRQLEFANFAKSIIEKLVQKDSITNEDLTALIQIFGYGSKHDNVKKYINSLRLEESFSVEIFKKFVEIGQTGFTGRGKHTIQNLTEEQLSIVHNFLKDVVESNSEDQLKSIVSDYENNHVPQVTSGIYSPWLYYLHPTICPIVAGPVNQYLKKLRWNEKSYLDAWNLLEQINQAIGEKNYGLFDAFIYVDKAIIDNEFDELFKNIARFLEQAQTNDLKTKDYIKQYSGLDISISFGTGNATKVPWICFLKKGERVQQGYYPSIYYDKDISILFVVLGISETNKPINTWPIDYAQKYITFKESLISQNVMERFPNSRIFSKYPIDKENITDSLADQKENIEKDLGQLIEIYTNGNLLVSHKTDLNLLLKKKQIILYGPPGTGKTFNTKNLAVQVIHDG